jgi:hypothetical protein
VAETVGARLENPPSPIARQLAATDSARFVSFPMGGGDANGTKQVIGLVALIAVAAFATAASGGLFAIPGALGAPTILGAGSGWATALMINALERKPSVGNQRDLAGQGGAYPDGRRSLPDGRDAFVNRPKVNLMPHQSCAVAFRGPQSVRPILGELIGLAAPSFAESQGGPAT